MLMFRAESPYRLQLAYLLPMFSINNGLFHLNKEKKEIVNACKENPLTKTVDEKLCFSMLQDQEHTRGTDIEHVCGVSIVNFARYSIFDHQDLQIFVSTM